MVLHVEDVDFSIPQLSGMPGRDAKNRAIVEKWVVTLDKSGTMG
jgi:hypothetical protein